MSSSIRFQVSAGMFLCPFPRTSEIHAYKEQFRPTVSGARAAAVAGRVLVRRGYSNISIACNVGLPPASSYI